MASGLDNLGVMRVTRIVQAIQDTRSRQPMRYRFSSRTPRVNAENGELMGRFVGRVLIADLIALDAVAAVYSSGRMKFDSHELAKIKMGRGMNEAQLEQFMAIFNGQITAEPDIVDFFEPIVDQALEGVAQRIEYLCVCMRRDRFDYDRFGYKAQNVTFGTRSDLKVTPSIPWTSTSATPVDDTLNLQEIGQIRYGKTWDRIVGSKQAFRYAIATTEFQNKAKPFLPADLTLGTNFSTLNYEQQSNLWRGVTGLTWEFSDDRYYYQESDGDIRNARYQPINEVFLEDSSDDNNRATWDVAAGRVIETMFMGLPGSAVIGAGQMGGRRPTRGPVGYMTHNPNLNPPDVALWAVDMAFPRKHVEYANAVLTVGQFADSISMTDPFDEV